MEIQLTRLAPQDGLGINQLARERLTWVLGENAADVLMKSVLEELQVDYLLTTDDLRRFASIVVDRGERTIGALLLLHAGRLARPSS